MRLLPLLLLAPSILAFSIPEGQSDGVYQVTYVDGEEKHTLLDRKDIEALTSSNKRRGVIFNDNEKRDPEYSCGGDLLNHADTDRANDELDAQLGNGLTVGTNMDIYSIVGCTVSYFCNFDWQHPAWATAQTRREKSAGITQTCGFLWSGWSRGGSSESYGYENFCKWPGSNFCGRGRNG